MKTLRLSWTALSLACLVPLLSAAPQDAARATKLKLDKKSQDKTAKAQEDLTEAQKDFQRLSWMRGRSAQTTSRSSAKK